jgi:hypothetical protein
MNFKFTRMKEVEVRMMRCRKSQNGDRGQNFVELALILPIILVLFFGMIEVGFAVHSYVIVANSAREGARFGARGVHVPLSDITGIVETSMSKSISADYFGSDANTTIIVTQIDLDEDGSYVIYDRLIHGNLPVVSKICEPSATPCDVSSLEVQDFIDANLTFNAYPELCRASAGCIGDFIVVEIFHSHESPILSGFARELIPHPFQINSSAVMRVLHHRAPS